MSGRSRLEASQCNTALRVTFAAQRAARACSSRPTTGPAPPHGAPAPACQRAAASAPPRSCLAPCAGLSGGLRQRRRGPRTHARRLRTLHHKVGNELRGVASILQQRRDAPRVALVAGLRTHKPRSGQGARARAGAWAVNAPPHTWRVFPAARPSAPARRHETPGRARAAAGGTTHARRLRVTCAARCARRRVRAQLPLRSGERASRVHGRGRAAAV